MRSLFQSSIFVPNCQKSVSKRIHLEQKNLKPTKIEYTLYCEDGKRRIKLQTFGYTSLEVSGCDGCPFQSGKERG